MNAAALAGLASLHPPPVDLDHGKRNGGLGYLRRLGDWASQARIGQRVTGSLQLAADENHVIVDRPRGDLQIGQ